jgi:hypothetical protein
MTKYIKITGCSDCPYIYELRLKRYCHHNLRTHNVKTTPTYDRTEYYKNKSLPDNCPLADCVEGKCENCKHYKEFIDYANCGICNQESVQAEYILTDKKARWFVNGEFCCKMWQPLPSFPK